MLIHIIILQTVGRHPLYKIIQSELWLMHDPELHVENFFKKLDILPVSRQYIFSLINLTVSNQENFQTNSPIHNINTRKEHHIHITNTNLSCFQKSTLYTSIKFFNCLPRSLIILENERQSLN